ncbi:hypothetical protein AJ80_00129 [Polytolypa hystricis UAMH7299]|uniref:Uncharacterized protein n=1 Tax=Polytolypa hystricis (strain UAMH7299) TaxID=1447883 RepID=A0A2B7Z532_POLH7|nr:hypothetical protein AJ80_00129 [Polytolypa hystricis UAMH7299]
MGSPRYSELGLTLGFADDHLPWYWKLLSSVSAWLLLAGFVIFPLAIDRHADLRGGPLALTVLAVILIALAYVISLLVCVRWRKTTLLLDAIYIPSFGSSLIGLFNVVLNIIVRDLQPLDTLSIIVITICSVSTAGFGLAALYNSHNVFFVPRRPGRPRKRRGEHEDLINDAELQRRQLLRLYLKNDSDRAPSPEVSQSTFRIDLPEGALDGDEEQHASSQQNQRHGITTPAQAHERPFQAASTTNNHPSRSSSPFAPSIRHHHSQSWSRREAREMRRSAVELGDL